MHTLYDFIQFIKGVEYILAVVFIILFTVFWEFMSRGKQKKDS